MQKPRFVQFGVAIDRVPQWRWLALLALALWPTWWWMVQRMVDGSDDPLGALALAALAVLLWGHRRQLRAAPRLGLQATALMGAVLTTVLHGQWPDLLVGLVSLLALAMGLLAFLPTRVAVAPVVGLSVLSLPLLASLQFYAGFPLRVVTAEVSAWVLSLVHSVERTGSSLVVDGQLIIVDAPCSGVQMVWLGYFTACTVALTVGLGNRSFVLRLPAVSSLVLLGNVVRNTALVGLQAGGVHVSSWGHDAIGLLVLAAVCTGIAAAMGAFAGRETVV
ncbi:exosortase Q [Curvibacter sp. CHRR-16]|uniref:exosortase Q n=1 Tax=Curvibacter sp. CHRR-16 TaxID=2835872 RepID=UPI002023B41B|nr:exosortase Q [Curvibacter sp. CHRR-16]